MRVAIYARVSKDDGTQDPENQLQGLREFAALSGWTIVDEYIDEMTGSRSDREQYQRMLTAASQRKMDLVLFWALDRFTREGTLATLQALQQLDSWGVGYRSYQESYLDSCGPFKDVVISLIATLAKQERLRISERTKAGLARARRSGKVLGRPRVRINVSKVRELQGTGLGLRAIASKTGWSLSSIMRALKTA